MQKTIGKRLEQLIFAKGFTSVQSFAKYMKKECPENYVSSRTISNVIKDHNVKLDTLTKIAKALGIRLEMLFSDNSAMVDYLLDNEVQPLINTYYEIVHEGIYTNCEDWMLDEENLEEAFEKRIKSRGYFQDVLNIYDVERCFYPSHLSETNDGTFQFHIKTLGELLIYLPICDMRVLSDILYRISGEIKGYEKYIVEKVNYLYNDIPDIPAKRFVNYCVMRSRLGNKSTLNEDEVELKERLKAYKKSDDYFYGCWQYMSALQNNCELYRDWQYDKVLENRYDLNELKERWDKFPRL